MKLFANPYRDAATRFCIAEDVPVPSVDGAAPLALLSQCPAYAPTPLVNAGDLADDLGIGALWIKDERARMGLGSFKALGAAYVIACDAVNANARAPQTALAGRTYVTASAGNHGLSVAAGARVFGAQSVIYIAETVPDSFADRLRAKGAEVRRQGANYEDSMAAAAQAARARGWHLLSDSSWDGYTDAPHRLMEGYLALMHEVFRQVPGAPTHLFLQAGVGGLAGACAAAARAEWGDAVRVSVVEPDAAPAVQASIAAGRFVTAQGPVSAMGRLDCKEASLIALKGLARDADGFALISEDEAHDAVADLARRGFETTPSGGAGFAAVRADTGGLTGLDHNARVLVILSEGPEI